ncbi:Toll-like receptor 7 like protein [Argiope bruennichi]|uniref:Toll-like receptor 7 like protein n=1 Tax=Argiope bruennichi TaxID=94029 RepID=A0A8T0G080_ARGBR|nr:Toll-like receptor 7 like protein [Argiope bruennichi]
MRTKICTLLLLLLCVALPALSSKCPSRDKLPTSCECEEEFVDEEVDLDLSCSGSTLDELNDALRLFDTNSKLEVQLDEMNLGTLPSRVFDGWNVVKLDISHCELDSLAPQGQVALAGLEDKLEVSFFFKFRFGPIKRSMLPIPAKKLKRLELDNNALKSVPDDLFLDMPELKLLSLNYNGIIHLPEKAFRPIWSQLEVFDAVEERKSTKIDLSHLRRLTALDLSYNAITELSDDWFARGPTSLTDLVLSNNGIEKIGDRAFANLGNLNKLGLDGNRFGPIKRSILPRSANKLKRLELEALQPIWSQLEVFDAVGNPFQCDSTMKWLFHVRSKAVIFGTCDGPEDKKFTHLDEFIANKGE